jgi:uncharacterized RDD family membrane protein YckC
MSAVQLRIGFLDTNYGSPVDVLNLIFYALLLAGLVRFRNDEKDSRLLRFCFSIIFLDNFLSLALGLLSILAAALNPYKDYPFSLYTVNFFLSTSIFLVISYHVIKYLNAGKVLSAIHHESDGSSSSFFDESSRNQRVLHLLVDTIIFLLLIPRYTHFLGWFGSDDFFSSVDEQTLVYGVVIIARLVYYFTMESIWSATPGKMLTNTRITNEYGDKVSIKAIFARTLSRFIPFDGLSFFGNRGWHDSISNTYVLKEAHQGESKPKETAIPSPF